MSCQDIRYFPLHGVIIFKKKRLLLEGGSMNCIHVLL